MLGAGIERGISPEGPRNQGITPEELSVYVSDYHIRIHERLYERGILPRGQYIDLTFPALPHQDSQAEYLYENTIGNDWVYIVLLRPYRRSSKHRHFHETIQVSEDIDLVSGKLFVTLGEDESSSIELTENSPLVTVPPETFHRSTTDGNFALYIAITRGAAPIARDKLHLSS